jgi:4a-hydroxytetrahydrobiopterin dehydratase
MSAQPVSPEQLRAALAALPGWSSEGEAIVRAWRFPDFASAIAFMAECAPDIEALNHHPEWTNVYDRVRARLTTHDAGNRVTELDVALAKLLEWKAQAFGARDA